MLQNVGCFKHEMLRQTSEQEEEEEQQQQLINSMDRVCDSRSKIQPHEGDFCRILDSLLLIFIDKGFYGHATLCFRMKVLKFDPRV